MKSRLKTLWEYVRHASVILRLMTRRRRQFAVNLISRDRRVVFVAEAPSGREMKLASGLRQAGWDVTLLYQRSSPTLNLSLFDDARQFHSPWDAGGAGASQWDARVSQFFLLRRQDVDPVDAE